MSNKQREALEAALDCIFGLHMQGRPWAEEDSNQSRTFMLLVAEAME